MPDTIALVTELNARVEQHNKDMMKAASVAGAAAADIERAFASTHADIQKRADALQRHLNKQYRQIGQDIGSALADGSEKARIALAVISAYSIKLAADATEIESAFDVAFKKSADNARDFSNVLADKVGRDAVETREAMTKLQLVLTGTGVAAATATELTKALATSAIDAGSLFNTSDAEAFQKIISGISGEAEPLKAFGVVINDAAMKAELLRLGFKGNAQDANEAAKSIARANLIIKGLAVAQGDAERTSGSAANTARRLRSDLNKAARDIGEQLLPAFVKAAQAADGAAKAFSAMPDGLQLASLAILGLVAAGGPIASLISGFANVIKIAEATRKAIIAVGTANALVGASAGGAAAGGVARGAAAGGLAASAAGGALVAGGVAYGALGIKGAFDAFNGGQRVTLVNELLKDPSKVRKLSDEDIAKLQQALRKDQSRKGEFAQTMYGDFGVDTTPARNALGILAGEYEARKKNAEQRAQAQLEAQLKQFDLGGDLLKPAAGTGSGKKSDKVSVATVRGRPINEAKLLVIDESTVVDLADFLAGKALGGSPVKVDSNPEGFRSAADIMEEVSGPLRDLQQQTYGRVYDGIRGGLEAGFREGLPGILDYLRYAIQTRLLDSLAKKITDSLTSNGTSTGGGSLVKFASSIGHVFGFADGGRPPIGRPYVVGENGPELKIDRAPSTILPNALLGALRSSAPASSVANFSRNEVYLTLNLEGANGDETIRRIAADAAMQGFQAARVAARGDLARKARNSIP